MHIFLVFSFFLCTFAPLNGENCCCSSVVEHFLGKEEVTSSSLVNSSEKEEPRLFLFCIRTSSNPPPPKPSLFEQKCRIAGVSPRGRLKRIEHFASSEYSVQSSPIQFISIHHHASVFGDRPRRVKTALERITSRFALHYIFLQAILISNRNQNKVQNFSFSTKFPVLAEYCRCIFLHLEHFTAFPNCYINVSF